MLMYAAGTDHPSRAASRALVLAIGDGLVPACIDSETLQEILHRYTAIRRWPSGRDLYWSTRGLFGSALPIDATTTDRASELLDRHPRLSARDAVHAAVVLIHGLDTICSFDRDLDGIPGVRRVEPRALLKG